MLRRSAEWSLTSRLSWARRPSIRALVSRPAFAIGADLPRSARRVAIAAVIAVGVRVNAEVVAGLDAIDLPATAVDGADVQPWRVAAPFRVFRAGRVARAALVFADTQVAALPHAARTLAAARADVELHAAGAGGARALAIAAALVAFVAAWARFLRTGLFLCFLPLGGGLRRRLAGQDAKDGARQCSQGDRGASRAHPRRAGCRRNDCRPSRPPVTRWRGRAA